MLLQDRQRYHPRQACKQQKGAKEVHNNGKAQKTATQTFVEHGSQSGQLPQKKKQPAQNATNTLSLTW